MSPRSKHHPKIQADNLPGTRADGFHDADLFFLLGDQRRDDVDHQQSAQEHGERGKQTEQDQNGLDDEVQRVDSPLGQGLLVNGQSLAFDAVGDFICHGADFCVSGRRWHRR